MTPANKISKTMKSHSHLNIYMYGTLLNCSSEPTSAMKAFTNH